MRELAFTVPLSDEKTNYGQAPSLIANGPEFGHNKGWLGGNRGEFPSVTVRRNSLSFLRMQLSISHEVAHFIEHGSCLTPLEERRADAF